MIRGVVTDGRARDALDLLVAQYERLTPNSNIFPNINEDDTEAVARLICSLALSGDFAQWGAAASVYGCMDGFLTYLGVTHLSELTDAKKERVSQAVWVCLRCVPERTLSDATTIIKRVARATARIHGDFAVLHTWGHKQVCGYIASITQEPVATFLIAKVLRVEVRVPHGGALNLMSHIALVDWTSGLLGGRAALRAEATNVLYELTDIEVLTILWWGLEGCEEACSLPCPCYSRCPSLVEGLV